MTKTNLIYVIIGLCILTLVVSLSAQIPGDVNHDNIVNLEDARPVFENWLRRQPDWLIVLNKYLSKKNLTLEQKQELHVAMKKGHAYLTGALYN